MLILAALSIIRLALLAGYIACLALGSPWWGVPLLVVFAFGVGCKPPAAIVKGAQS